VKVSQKQEGSMTIKQNNFKEVKKLVSKAVLAQGHCVPHLFVFGSKSQAVAFIPELPRTADERVKLLLMIGQKVAKDPRIGDLKEFYFVSESWLSSIKKGAKVKSLPSKDPKRKEAVIIAGTTLIPKSKTRLAVFEMIKDKKGKLETLKPFTKGTKGQAEMPLIEAFVFGFNAGKKRTGEKEEKVVH
jgi:hypothetical protein